jgi:hypothetical protein
VKTGRRDALALVSCLDLDVAGNTEALPSIRIPTEQEERARGLSKNMIQRAWQDHGLKQHQPQAR